MKFAVLLLGAEAACALSFGHVSAGARGTSRPAALSSLSMVATDYESEAAAAQQGNNAFLNEDLMKRAIDGPG
eukprot:4062950-Prymnesium_polylepis.1